jgi:hypothetical protein
MSDISTAFNKDTNIVVDYYLSLPQSFGRNKSLLSRPAIVKSLVQNPNLGSAEVLDSSVFSPTSSATKINLSSKILDLERKMCTPVKRNTISIQEIQGESSVPEDNTSINESLFAEGEAQDWQPENNVEGTDDADDVANVTGVIEKSTIQDLLMNTPKSATLILETKGQSGSDSSSSWTYEGPIGILDDEYVFKQELPLFDEYYLLKLSQTGSRSMIDTKELAKKLKKIEDIVHFRVFCHEFKKSYVGNSGNSAAQTTATIQNCANRLRTIKMVSRDTASG